MIAIASLQRGNHGSHFRAYGLRSGPTLISPFLGVDHYWMSAPTFPPHAHTGISAVSYPFLDSETGIVKRDSIGTHNLIQPGGLHWTTAGRGVVHEEVPAETGKTVHALQIFVDLASARRDMAPFPLTLEPQDVPVIQMPGAKVRVPLGSYGETRSPLNPPTEVTMLDISLEEGAELSVPITVGHCTFVMPIYGTVKVGAQRFDRENLKIPVFSAQNTPSDITLGALEGGVKVVLFSGPPLPFL